MSIIQSIAKVTLTLFTYFLTTNSFATTIVPLEFSVVVEQAGTVIEGTVINIQYTSTGIDIRNPLGNQKQSSPPFRPDEVATDQNAEPQVADVIDNTDASVAPPQALPVEGGRMIFTEITLSIDNKIVGNTDSTVTFRVAGGFDAETKTEVTVFGMPSFELNKRYLVMLRPDFDSVADPIVGINQGFFEIVPDAQSGEDMLLNHDGDIVVAIENDIVIVRHNASRATRPLPNLAPAPVPAPGSVVQASISSEVTRYRSSVEQPMKIDNFFAAIHSAKEN